MSGNSKDEYRDIDSGKSYSSKGLFLFTCLHGESRRVRKCFLPKPEYIFDI